MVDGAGDGIDVSAVCVTSDAGTGEALAGFLTDGCVLEEFGLG
jgi:hypothetical protein